MKALPIDHDAYLGQAIEDLAVEGFVVAVLLGVAGRSEQWFDFSGRQLYLLRAVDSLAAWAIILRITGELCEGRSGV